MLLVLTLTLCANIAFASTDTTTNVSNQNTSQTDPINGQNLDKNTVKSSEQQNTEPKTEETVTAKTEQAKNLAAGAPANTTNKAAGSASTTKTVTTEKKFTSSQINDAAYKVKTFIDKNKRLPSFVTISSAQVSMPQFLQLLTTHLLNIKDGRNLSVTLKQVTSPSKPTESVKNGKLYKSDYLSMSKAVKTAIDKNGIAPSNANSSLGKMRYESLIYNFSKIVAFYKSNKRLPNYVTVSPWSKSSSSSEGNGSSGSNTTPASVQKYLNATTNAQSTSTTIKNMAASITKGKTTTYTKAQAIFNWVRDHLSYSFYYNSKKGALGALSSRTANCCDTSHLVVALSRAAGIPARYQHGTCKFSSGTYGHVWAQLYVNGKWYYADAISSSNTLGSIKNWNLNSYKLHGTYASLPF